MPITINNDFLMNHVGELNLDLEFIKKLHYYNKNLEDQVELYLHSIAKFKNQEIETRRVNLIH